MRVREWTLSRLVAAIAAAGVAFGLSACGSSNSSHASTSVGTSSTVSASVMADAANKAAVQPGYAFTFKFAASGQAFKGNSAATGAGRLQAHRLAGTVTTAVTLPSQIGGVASLLGTIKTTILLPGDNTAYLKVPGGLTSMLQGKSWLKATPSDLSSVGGKSGDMLSSAVPSEAFKQLAAASTGTATNLGTETIDGQTTTHYTETIKHSGGDVTIAMWIGSDGLPYQLAAGASHGGSHAVVTLDITSFDAQPAPSAPPAGSVGSLSSVLHQASSFE